MRVRKYSHFYVLSMWFFFFLTKVKNLWRKVFLENLTTQVYIQHCMPAYTQYGVQPSVQKKNVVCENSIWTLKLFFFMKACGICSSLKGNMKLIFTIPTAIRTLGYWRQSHANSSTGKGGWEYNSFNFVENSNKKYLYHWARSITFLSLIEEPELSFQLTDCFMFCIRTCNNH